MGRRLSQRDVSDGLDHGTCPTSRASSKVTASRPNNDGLDRLTDQPLMEPLGFAPLPH